MLKVALDLLLPPKCPGCGTEGEAICAGCRTLMQRRLDEPAGVPIGLPTRQPAGLVQLEWCCPMNGPARAAIHALKYDGERRLVDQLSKLMAARWRVAGIGGELLVPVPVHAARRRERGFDQAELLARQLGRELHLPTAYALQRAAKTAAMHKLGRDAREANVRSAFAVAPRHAAAVNQRWIVLVDDVVTTGATLSGCARALYEAGASAVSALTLARER
ncbi:MAG TPA: ComF family protein [Candidatus Limnocylindrales bacterium]|nr:ComF family protein [Candidatus Limnocylindrales bacterium]